MSANYCNPCCSYTCLHCQGSAPSTFPYNVPYTGQDATLRQNWFQSQANPTAPFTTNPNWPLNTGSNHSQIYTNQENKTIFNSINKLKEQGGLFGTGQPTFSSNQEKIKYIQAQYSQRAYGPRKGINTLYS